MSKLNHFRVSEFSNYIKQNKIVCAMKRILKFVVILVLIMAAVKGPAQTKVRGHVFAEVVESVSANSSSQSSVTIQRNQTDIIDFGQIEIKSEASASCAILLGRANLISNNNQHISMETSAYSTISFQRNASNGNLSINLQCLPDKSILDQNATFYQGEIQIVLAYN